MRSGATPATLLEAASAPYRAAGHFAYHFARGKLRGDPVFTGILAQGLLAASTRILDLGCGQGLLAAWLLAAAACTDGGEWPRTWPGAPRPRSIRGIDRVARDIERARRALGNRAEFELGDIREVEFGGADAVVILDVLHFMDYASQEQVLARVRAALAPQGLLLLRVGDAAASLGFKLTQWVDHAVVLARRRGLTRFYCRPLAEWLAILADIGFQCRALPMSAGTLFPNVLLVARTA